MICKKCGTRINQNNKLCQKCGSQISEFLDSEDIEWKISIKIWFLFCIAANIFLIIYQIITNNKFENNNKYMLYPSSKNDIIVYFIIASISVFYGYIVLFFNKLKVGYYLILLGSVMYLIAFIQSGNFTYCVFFICCINPIITFWAIRKYWRILPLFFKDI
ncbi:MAG: TFIIB-type zinc ribbon-containing protein [Oscillospiraceae bacterium]|nr:TFIIB-type zinc ribbon-containing protein [Oscillospiraceae bacterium]